MTRLDTKEIKKHLSITQLLAYYKAIPANPNGLYFCINCKSSKPSLLAYYANSRAKCEAINCEIKGADIFYLIRIIEKCSFKDAKIRANQIAQHLNSHQSTRSFYFGRWN